MDHDPIVRRMLEKGHKNVNISMFSENDRKIILQKLAEHLMRLNRTDELIGILEHIDPKKYEALLKEKAETLMNLGQYGKAAEIYEKLGEKEFADSLRKNFN